VINAGDDQAAAFRSALKMIGDSWEIALQDAGKAGIKQSGNLHLAAV